jgi:hypothetical protein
MDIVDLDVPLLMGLDVIIAYGVKVEMSSMKLRSPSWIADVELRDGHVFVPPTHGTVLFSDTELQELHKNSHLSASKLHSFYRNHAQRM